MVALTPTVPILRYPRTTEHRRIDFANARANEQMVGSWIGGFKLEHLDSPDEMDWTVPAIAIDVKEKRQPLGPSWPLPAGCSTEDAFVLDELSIRRALAHHPGAYVVLHDLPLGRSFLARADEVVRADRVRLNRRGPTDIDKGKRVVNLRQFRQLTNPVEQLMPTILVDTVTESWNSPACRIV